MKIGIVTVYNSYNCGSFLQAYALYKTLIENHDVVFLKREPYKPGKLWYRVCLAIKYVMRRDFRRAGLIFIEHFCFKKMQKKLPKTDTLDGLDLVIYGSDTIWNLDVRYFRDNWEKYWGNGVKNKKITYAASVSSTDKKEFSDNPELKKCINEFSGVSVRDEHTYAIAQDLLENKKPVRVIDPTMLLSPDDYVDVTGKCKKDGFILVYFFGDMTKEQKTQMKNFAKSHNKKIVFFGKNIPFSPKRMISCYKAADYVITNTFHGNVFSILFNKKFISYGKHQKKVSGLLEEFGLSKRLLNNDDAIDEVLSSEINYDNVNALLSEKRNKSLNYLKQFTDGMDGEF
ncbi:MAG: polysaccharide pyruvyl transferase family protein [Ruminococcaceae bacterium]|nr:polysaccharide pyruvyl transferase family protein [Oscillospiraceae bacterium]